jgi:hypothetical protein
MACKHHRKKKASPVTEVNFRNAVYPSGQMDLPSLKDAESSTIFPERRKFSIIVATLAIWLSKN